MDTRLETRTDVPEPPPLTIRRVDAIPVALPLKKPMAMAGVTITDALNLLVRIEAADGSVGWGEAASAPTMTGDTLTGLVAAVRDHLGPLLIGEDARLRPRLRRKLKAALYGNPGAHSAVEMALLDLAGKASGVSVVDLIGGAVRRAVAPMWLLGNATTEQDVAEAQLKRAEGFGFFKLKIGTKPVATEIAATRKLRDAFGSAMPLCADANCGLSFDDARRYLDGTRDASLMFVEQPLAHDDLDGLARLTAAAPMPIGADEGIHSLADIEAHARCGVGGVSLKLIKLGGIGAAVEAARLCERTGLAVNVAAKIAESSIASAATVHLACAAPSVAWGVSLTHFYLAADLVKTALAISDGRVAPPAAPGLGVEVDEAAVESYRLR
jgi:muconate cycloisomerase